MEDYAEKFSRNQKIKVRIIKAFIRARDQSNKIDLLLANENPR